MYMYHRMHYNFIMQHTHSTTITIHINQNNISNNTKHPNNKSTQNLTACIIQNAITTQQFQINQHNHTNSNFIEQHEHNEN